MGIPNPRNSLGEYAWVWDAICWVSAGEGWPSGDEDSMRELADAWREMADLLSETLAEADPAVMKILQAWGGGAGEAFGALWNQIGVDPNTGLPLVQEVAAAYAGGCDAAALEIEYAKLTVLIAVMITVIAVFVALLMAWLGGVSAGAIPGILAAGRQAVTVAMRRLIAQMGRQLLTRAGMRAALRMAGTKVGQIVTSQGFRQGMSRLGRELVEEIGEELIIDVGAQAYQMNSGERTRWDTSRTVTAGLGGAYGAVLGTGLSAAARRVAPRMPVSFSPSGLTFPGSGVVRWGSNSLAAGMQNAVVSPAASVLANGTMTGQWAMPGADAFLGGFTSGAGRSGLTAAGSATGSGLASLTNRALGAPGISVGPGAGPGAPGVGPGQGVGGANGSGSPGGGTAGNGSAGGGSAGNGSAGGGTAGGSAGGGSAGGGSTAGGGTSGSGSSSGSGSTSGSGSGTGSGSGSTTGSDTGAAGTSGSGTDTGQTSAPDTGSGSISLAPPTAEAPAPTADTATADTAPSTADAVPAGNAPTDATTQAGVTAPADAGTPQGVVTPTGDTGQAAPPTGAADAGQSTSSPVTSDQPTTASEAGPSTGDTTVTGPGDPAGSGPAEAAQAGPVDAATADSDTVASGGATAADPTSVSVDPTRLETVGARSGEAAVPGPTLGDGRGQDRAAGPAADAPPGAGPAAPASTPTTPSSADTDSLAADGSPAFLPGPPATAVPNQFGAVPAGPATATPAGPATATPGNPATAVPTAAGPPATPATPTPTTAPAPGTTAQPGTTTSHPGTSTNPNPGAGTQAPSNRTAPTPGVNPSAVNSAGSISLTPAAGPSTAQPAADGRQPTGDQTSRSDTGPDAAPVRPDGQVPQQPVPAGVPTETAGVRPADVAPDATPAGTPPAPADAPTDLGTSGTPQADTDAVPAPRSPVDGPVVVPVPASTGTTPTNSGAAAPTPGAVDPSTLTRSTGPTGRGTHSWHLDTTTAPGDPAGPDAEQAMIEASRTLAETVRQAVKATTVSRGKQPGTAGALLMPDGDITTHTSMTPDKGTTPRTDPVVHRVAKEALARTEAALKEAEVNPGGGHGKCAEVALVSDQLYRLEQQWRVQGEPGTFEQFALAAFQNSKITTHQIATARSGDVTYELGHYRPPCRSCAHFLPQFGIEPVVDTDRTVEAYQPPVPGVVGNGQPLSDTRPYGQPQGVVPPSQADQQALQDAVPRDPATGRPLVHPDPRVGAWAGLVNDGGPTVQGRSNNCADVGLSFLSTWFGRPEVAAPVADPSLPEFDSTDRQERAVQSEYRHRGTGTTGLDAVAEALRQAGPGAAAIIITSWAGENGRAHTWNAVNHNGTIVWVDGQNRLVSDVPVHSDRVAEVWSIVLDAAGDPVVPATVPADTGTTSQQTVPLPPASTAPVDQDATNPDHRDGAATRLPGPPGFDPAAPRRPDAAGVPVPPDVPPRQSGSARQPDRAGPRPGVDPGGDLGPGRPGVDVSAVRGDGGPLHRPGPSPDQGGRPGDGGAGVDGVRDGAAADGGRVDGDLPPGELSADPTDTDGAFDDSADGDGRLPDVRGWPLPDTRRIGPGELAPLEDIAYQQDVEASLRTADGYAYLADPSTHPYGRLINDGGPDRQGRSNNCLDCSLAALSSFYGDPQVSLPRWPDRLPDGSIDRVTGEQGGIGRAAAWIGGEWTGGPAGLPGEPAARAAAVADRYADLYRQVAEAGPGSSALLVAEWLAVDEDTGDPVFDPESGDVVSDGAHAFVIVFPPDADQPVWWDPQRGVATSEPPTPYVRLTHSLWAMMMSTGGADHDQGRGAGADHTTGADPKSDRSSGVRVRLAGQGEALGAGTGLGDARGPGELHHRPDGSGHGPLQPATDPDHRGVQPGPPGGPDQGSPGVADGGSHGLTDPVPFTSAAASYGMPETRNLGPGELAPLEDGAYQQDVEASLRTPEGYAYLADPSTHPYGRLINDGGPGQQGRSNNCLDCSLAALSSFYGDPQVSLPRWPDVRADGTVETEVGEQGGLDRARAWIDGDWAGGRAGLPSNPDEHAAAVADQYAQLHRAVLDGGPGSAALVVAEWLAVDDATGELVLDADGGVTVGGAHAFVLVYPVGADGPVWWDPQHGTTSVEMPAAYVEGTYALWSMMVPTGGGTHDGGRGTGTDHPTARDAQPGPAGGVRVRLGGEGGTLGTGAGRGDARGPGQLHHRPDGDRDGALQPAAATDPAAVRGGPATGPLHGPAGVAPGGTDSLTAAPITASAVPGTDFHGQGRRTAEPDAVLAAAQAAMPSVAPLAGVRSVVAAPDGSYRVTRADGTGFDLRVDSGPVADGAVASSVFDSDGTAVVTVSDRAADRVVERALAHEVAELAALGQPTTGAAAVVAPLSPADVAELVTAGHQARTADRWSRAAARRELAAVVDRLGLRAGMLGAEQRAAALPAEVREVLADASSGRSARSVDRARLRADRRAAEAGRPTGLPRMRTYLVTHFTVNSMLAALAVKLTLDFGGRPELALMLGAGGLAGAVATGPAKWLAKRAGLAAEDRRARHDARQDARVAAEADADTGTALAAPAAEATAAAREAGDAVTGLGDRIAAVQEQLSSQERRHRLMGRPHRFPPTGDPSPAAPVPGTPTTPARPGPAGLTPHEQGRLAELRSLAARHGSAAPWARPRAGREIRALLDALGLRQGTPGAEQRRDLLPADVRSVADRFGDSRTAAVRDRLRVVADRRPAEGERPGKVAPWWMSVAENAPHLLTAGTIAAVGDLLNELRLGWFGIAGALATAATGMAVDPVIARREAAAKDARDAWDVANPAIPADALLAQAAAAVGDPVAAVSDRAAEATRRTADLEQRVADLDRRLAESRRRTGLTESFRRLIFGDPVWAGLPASGGNPSTSTATTPTASTGTGAGADPATPTPARRGDPRDTAALQRLGALAARHATAGPLARPALARQVRALVDQLGLLADTPGAAQRRELLPADLRPVVERFGQPGPPARVGRFLSRPPADATDSSERPGNVPGVGVYAVEQVPGPLVQAGATVAVARAVQVAAGVGPMNMLAGGLAGPLRDLLLKRLESRVKDDRRAWDLARPNPATAPTARVDALADPAVAAVTDAARQLDAVAGRLDGLHATIDRLADPQAATRAPGPVNPASPIPASTGPGSARPATDPSTAATAPAASTPQPPSRADSWELQTAAHHVRTADPVALPSALRELHAVIDRLGLRDGMLGAADRVAQLPPEARQVVTEYGGDRAGRARQLHTLRAERRAADGTRPPGLPRLRTYLLSSLLTGGTAGAAATAAAIAVASPLAPVIPVAALVAAPVVGVAKWHAKRAGLAVDDRRTRFDARSDARAAADQVDQVVDRLAGPVADLERAADRLARGLDAAGTATDGLADRLADAHRRTGLLSRLLGSDRPGRADPTPAGPDPTSAGPDPEPDTGRITAAAVPHSGFHGLGRPDADPSAVQDVARAALPQVAPYAGVDAVVAVGPDLFEVRTAGLLPLRVQLTTGPLTDGVVAQSTRNPDGSFTVTVSDRAVDAVVARALAHEIAELAALHEAGQALVGTLDPGNVGGLVDPAGLTAHDRGRMAEIRLLADEYATADAATRVAVRAEIDALADHLGLRVGDPDARARWAVLPRDVLNHLMRLSVPVVTPETVSRVLAGGPDLTEVQRFRMYDYRARLAPDLQVPGRAELDARLRELAARAEDAQASMPRMPAFAGQVIGLPADRLARIREVDPALADRLAAEGVYVDLTGRYDLRPYLAPGHPEIDLGAARPEFDLTTEAGRQAHLFEDRHRARAALRAVRGADQAAALLVDHDLHYQGDGRWMGLAPDVLTEALRGFTPDPTPSATPETVPTQPSPGETRVVADRVTLPAAGPGTPRIGYGQPLDADTGQPPPLFDGPPKPGDVQQGMLGDCGMIAVIRAVAGQLPDTVSGMFQPNPDGTVDVLLHETTLPGRTVTPTGRQLRVTVHPDVPLHPNSGGRSAYADQSTVGVAWASLLEKAVAALDRTWSPQRHDQWQRQWSQRPDTPAGQAAPMGYARLNAGSSRLVQAELLSQLTGLPTAVSDIDPTPGREAAVAAHLAELLAAGSPVITGTRPASGYAGKPGYGLVPGHAYVVESVRDGEVQLRNPWNSNHPAPMPVADFVALTNSTYAHVELARTALPELPGAGLSDAGRPAADPTAVLDAARAALPTLAEAVGADGIFRVTADTVEVRVAGREPLRVTVAAGPLAAGTVAGTVRNLDGTFTLTLSDRAADTVVDRALAHEVAELVARHADGDARVGLFDAQTDGPIDPAGLSARDRGRLAELRMLARRYADADPADRLAVRAEIDALADHLGLRSGIPDAHARWAVLPADAAAHLMRLSTPRLTPEALDQVLRGGPDQHLVDRFRQIDHRGRLAPDLRTLTQAEVDTRLRELAVEGEQAQTGLPRMPACAGQVVALPPALQDWLRQVDPQLADRVAAQGVYVDLTGRFDLRPYTLDGAPEISVDASQPAYDLRTEHGRQALLAEDRARAVTTLRTRYGANPAAMAVLTTHDFHYLADARVMALVPDALTRALHAMVPGAPPLDVEVTSTVTDGQIAVVADRVTLPDTDPKRRIEYGQPLVAETGQPAPVLDGVPRREQVQQGSLGDCGMLATMGAVAAHRPDLIARLFHPNPDGTVDVLLHESTPAGDTTRPTGRRLRVTVHPDVPVHAGSTWTAYADQTAQGVAWVSLLEKAVAAIDRTWTGQRHEQWQRQWAGWHSPSDPHRAAPLGYARLGVGSTPDMQAELLTQLTGLPSRTTWFDTTVDAQQAQARLTALLAAGSPVITATRAQDQYPAHLRTKLPYDLVTGHAYEVVAVRNGEVLLHNPWGSQHPPAIPVQEFLALTSGSYAHLDLPPTPPPVPDAHSVPPVPPLPPGPPAPPSPDRRGPETDRPQHTLGRTDLDEERSTVGYLALLATDGTVVGLAVVETSTRGQRSARWTVDGAVPTGGSLPVDRPEAERIAREVLGFALPGEPALRDMLDG
ncbi:Calpain family cysteine protease [Micromonospora nigra]|uniref:Calpain family cysteine protease n=1 Tax=Micromonospora nigra TaxID=145857 RepID=A0A1C6RWH3_9ACTN|nr:toxin glutamine deamidase domain-containing protein [Micromonospora nigra]SCL21525.1 Calpain family cysteine protease [Micromonospora nigra]